MAQAKIVRQVTAITANKVGMMAEVSSAISAAGVNISAICAFAMEDQAHFLMIASDNAKVLNALKAKGYNVSEEDVVSVDIEDKPGKAAELAKKIKAAGIDIRYLYGTTCKCSDCNTCTMIINSKDNKKVVQIVNG